MAKIIYKSGHEFKNKLDSIDGIWIKLFNGRNALIYPKYSEKQLLDALPISECDIKTESEIKALKKMSSYQDTSDFYRFDSPAAKFVRQFKSEHFTQFSLPTLLTAMEIQDQKNEIDELAKTIEGADLLRNFTHDVWTCSRYNDNLGWVAVGSFGFADKGYLCGSGLAVPTILY